MSFDDHFVPIFSQNKMVNFYKKDSLLFPCRRPIESQNGETDTKNRRGRLQIKANQTRKNGQSATLTDTPTMINQPR